MEISGKLGRITVGDNVKTRIMGIINLSPTSFFKGSIKQSNKEIESQLLSIADSNANFIDVGTISSAPVFLYKQQEEISTKIEIQRLTNFFSVYNNLGLNIDISVDTQSSKTANYALSQGASIINDVSGFKSDPDLPRIISEYNGSAIVMSCRKKPGDIFSIDDIITELNISRNLGVRAGIKKSDIIIDPGLGGWVPQREAKDDYVIIKHLAQIRQLSQCILVGISRKSFIGKILSISQDRDVPPEERLWGSLAATTVAILNGAHIIRTHDVQETADVCLITDYLKKIIEKETY
jgi:dihydropteroate synthase